MIMAIKIMVTNPKRPNKSLIDFCAGLFMGVIINLMTIEVNFWLIQEKILTFKRETLECHQYF